VIGANSSRYDPSRIVVMLIVIRHCCLFTQVWCAVCNWIEFSVSIPQDLKIVDWETVLGIKTKYH